MININKKIKKYIEEHIFPSYEKNDLGHNLDHIKYVIERSFKFADTIPNINYDMVYVIAAYHDIGHYVDAKNHEKISSEMLLHDENLKRFFTEEEINIMAEAVYDHRASIEYEPRSIYGKIVSSADRNVSLESPIKRTYQYNLVHYPNASIDEIIELSRNHLFEKFGKKGYASKKMYFKDDDYEKFIDDIDSLTRNKNEFRKLYIKINNIKIEKESNMQDLKMVFEKIKRENPNMSLDEILYAVYVEVKDEYNQPFDVLRNKILEENEINELDYYTRNVNRDLKDYISKNIFPEYDKNDGGHNLAHIIEVIRRSFALNDTFKLGLDDNMIYAIAACHDWGKYEDHATHNLIAAKHFMDDEGMKKFFTDEERQIIKEAIEDHRSSKEDEPRTTYGKLISSADRNTRIEIVFIRSFFVAKERMPEDNIEDYLDFTIKRLSKKYDEKNPENMFFEDQTYKVFIEDMRSLLKKEEEFKDRYCEVNHITSRDKKVKDYDGETAYANSFKPKHNPERGKFLSSIYLVIKNNEGKVLLQRRQGTKLWPGFLALPAGHIDEGENAYEAAIREAKEELNIEITIHDIIDTYVVNRINKNLPPYYDVYFELSGYIGEIEIAEPEKCSELVWCNPNNLPEDIIPFEKEAMENNSNNIKFSVTFADDAKDKEKLGKVNV